MKNIGISLLVLSGIGAGLTGIHIAHGFHVAANHDYIEDVDDPRFPHDAIEACEQQVANHKRSGQIPSSVIPYRDGMTVEFQGNARPLSEQDGAANEIYADCIDRAMADENRRLIRDQRLKWANLVNG